MLIEIYVFHLSGKIMNLINLRYYHILKTHYLNGKCNHHVDQLINILVFSFLLELDNQHIWQMSGIEGLDLEDIYYQQICASGRNIFLDSIY